MNCWKCGRPLTSHPHRRTVNLGLVRQRVDMCSRCASSHDLRQRVGWTIAGVLLLAFLAALFLIIRSRLPVDQRSFGDVLRALFR